MQGCPLSTVKTRLYQGLTVLRRELDRQGIESLAGGKAQRPAPVADPSPAPRGRHGSTAWCGPCLNRHEHSSILPGR